MPQSIEQPRERNEPRFLNSTNKKRPSCDIPVLVVSPKSYLFQLIYTLVETSLVQTLAYSIVSTKLIAHEPALGEWEPVLFTYENAKESNTTFYNTSF